MSPSPKFLSVVRCLAHAGKKSMMWVGYADQILGSPPNLPYLGLSAKNVATIRCILKIHVRTWTRKTNGKRQECPKSEGIEFNSYNATNLFSNRKTFLP